MTSQDSALPAAAAGRLPREAAGAGRLPQERRVVTEIPGPSSRAMAERRKAAVPPGVGSVLPVQVTDADGGVLVDADANSLIDLGSGIAVTSVGNANPRVVERVKAQAERFPAIGDVRGRGAMVAIELVRPGTKEPDAELTAEIARRRHARGVLVLTAGTYGNVLRFLPPLVIPEHLLTEGLDVIEEAFAS